MKPYGTCTEMKILHPAIGSIHCDREQGHPGSHFDRAEHMYWLAGAPKLETIEAGRALAGKEKNEC